jgi:DNA-binding LytR/AlgR family response regulator
MNITVLIIEDNADDALLLIETLKNIPFIIQIKHVETVEEALEGIISGAYDLVFLDLLLAKGNAIDILKSMSLPPTVVVSAHPAYAVSTYDIDSVIDFIEKPVTYTRLLRALKRTTKEVKGIKHLYLKAGRQILYFSIDDIRYIEADGIYSKVYLKDNNNVLVNDNISEIEKKLRHTRLVRLHKSYIYNLNFVTSFDSRSVFMDTQKFQLGVHYRSKLAQLFDIGNK